MWACSSCPHRSQRQRSGRGQRTSKPCPSWWRSYPVISTPGGKSTSIVTLAMVSVLARAEGVDPDADPGDLLGSNRDDNPGGSPAKRQENPRPRTLERKSLFLEKALTLFQGDDQRDEDQARIAE